MFADQQALDAHDKEVHQRSHHTQGSLKARDDGCSVQLSPLGQKNTKTLQGARVTNVLKNGLADRFDNPTHLVRYCHVLVIIRHFTGCVFLLCSQNTFDNLYDLTLITYIIDSAI